MTTSRFNRPILQWSPLRLWFCSQLLFWTAILMAGIADYAQRTSMENAWRGGTLGVVILLLGSVVLLVLAAVDLARARGPIRALILAVGTVIVTKFALGIAALLYMDFMNLPH